MKRTLKRDIPKDYSFLDLVAPSYNRLKITPKFVTGGPLKTSSQFSLNPDPYDTDPLNLFNYNQDGSTSTTTKKGEGTPSKMLMVPGYDPNFNYATTTPVVDQTKLNFMQDPVRNSSINNNNTTTSINTQINRGTPINLRVPEDPNNPDELNQGVDQRKLNWLQDPVRNKVDQTLVDESVAAADQRVADAREKQRIQDAYLAFKNSQPQDQPDMDQSDIDRITAEEAAANQPIVDQRSITLASQIQEQQKAKDFAAGEAFLANLPPPSAGLVFKDRITNGQEVSLPNNNQWVLPEMPASAERPSEYADPVQAIVGKIKTADNTQAPNTTKKNNYKPYSVNPFTTGLNLFNAGLNTVGGMRNNNRMRNQENLNGFITQQPEAVYPNKRMLYGDKSMFAEYGGEYANGGELPMYYKAGEVMPPIYGKDPKRVQAYSDSMALYNNYIDNLNTLRSAYGKDFESNKNYTVVEKKEEKKEIDSKKRANPKIKEGLNSKNIAKHNYRRSRLGSREITGMPIGSVNKEIFEKNIKQGNIPSFDLLYHTDIMPTGEHNFMSPGILGTSRNPYLSPFPIVTNQPTTIDDRDFTAGNGDVFKYRYRTNPLNTFSSLSKYDKPVQPYYLEEDPEPEPLEDKVKEPEPIKKIKIKINTSEFPLPAVSHRYDGPDKLYVQGPNLPNGAKYMTIAEYDEYMKANEGKYRFNPTPNSVGYIYQPGVGIIKNSDYKPYENGGELPMYEKAGTVLPTIYTSNPYDYRIKNYNDSLKLYNTTQKLIKEAKRLGRDPLPMSWLSDYSLGQLQANNHGSYSRDPIYGPYGSIVGRSPASQLPRSTYNTRRADGTFERNMPIDDTTEYARRYHGGDEPQPYSVLHYKKPVQPIKYRKEEPKPKEDPEPIPVPVRKPITKDSFTLGLPVIKHTVNSDSTVQVAGPGVKNGSKTMTFKEYDEFAKNNFKKYNFSSQPNSVGKVYKPGKGIMQYEVGGEVEDADHFVGTLVEYKKGGIYIKPENKGKFTAWADAHGMSVQEAASHVMANKEKYSSTIVKRANFAKNASKFKHEKGGEIDNDKEMVDGVADILSRVNDVDNRKELARYMTNQFNDENVDYNYDQFLNATNLTEMGYGGMYSYGGHYIPQDVPYLAGKFVPNPIDLQEFKKGGMIKRADGTYSKRGLWDNIRANKGSGKKPTKEMLKQEKKIKKGYKAGGEYMEGNEYEISGAELERLRSLGYDVEMI